MSIAILPGARLSPEVTLHRVLDRIDRIKSVIVVIQEDDDRYDLDWSQQQLRDLTMGAVVLMDEATRMTRNDGSGVIMPPKDTPA
jgi:hypothetical protein